MQKEKGNGKGDEKTKPTKEFQLADNFGKNGPKFSQQFNISHISS
jgi:hypothetical protein